MLTALLIMSAITVLHGSYTALTIRHAGSLVAETFDKSLMSINYARAAAADFGTMQAALARRPASAEAAVQDDLDTRIETLARSLHEDLDIAASRSQSPKAARAAANAQEAVASWNEARRQSPPSNPGDHATWLTLDRHADTVSRQIELLVNYTAGDAFTYRQFARLAVRADLKLNVASTGAALLLLAMVVLLLARRIIGPVAAASKAALEIASGNLDGAIPGGGTDELGALLAAMAVMRDNIRSVMHREAAQHQIAQTRLATALESSREGLIVVEPGGDIVLASSRAATLLGVSPSRLRPGTPFVEATAGVTVSSSSEGDLGLAMLAHLVGMNAAGQEEYLVDGRWVRVSQSAVLGGGFVAICSDVTELKSQGERLKATNLRLDAALENMSQGLCLYDAGRRLQVVNRRFCELFNLHPADVHLGLRFDDVVALSVAAGNHPGQTAASLVAERMDHVTQSRLHGGFLLNLSQDRVIAVVHRPMPDGGWVATYEDVTERRRADAQIVHMARHDALTGLPNRILFGERVEQALAQAGRNSGFALFCLDLDRFKIVNDTLGHPMGDELLQEVSRRLQACLREVDTVARLGGDEFAIVQAGSGAPADASALAQRIIEAIAQPYRLSGQCVTIGASIGIALASADGIEYSKLLKCADMALYRAKSQGRGTWCFFEPAMDAQLQARRQLELDLQDALARNQFEVFYQPLYDLVRGRIGGFEALLRWHHPTRGFVSPVEFIPVAEELGIIIPLGKWALQTACADASKWPSHVKLAVNVSPAQFKDGQLAIHVHEVLLAASLPANRLELEITESVLLTESASTLASLHAIRDLGVRISMDDFGTGYSSLSYLRSFPFDKIKIDRSFIRDLGTQGSGAIVRAMLGLGKTLGMQVMAEGVETEQQLAWLRNEGCSEAQGYLFGTPKSASSVPQLLMNSYTQLLTAA